MIRPMSSRDSSLQLGIIGAGRVAQEHVKGILAAGSRVAAVCDLDDEKAAALAAFVKENGGGEPTVATIGDLLSDASIPAVVISVPNVAHAEVAIECLNAGKDVLLEKPMAMSVAECDSIIGAMQQSGRMVQMGFVCRGSAKVQAAADIVASGRLGTIYHVKASAYRQRGIPGLGGWFTTRATSGGGVLVDIGVHLIDLVMHLTGTNRARAVSGVCEARFGSPIADYVYEEMWAGPPRPDGVCDVEDSAMGLIRFDNDMTCEMNLAWASNLPQNLLPDGIALLGDRGGLFFDIFGDKFTLVTQEDGKVVETTPPVETADLWNSAWRRQHERFAEAVHNRTAPTADAYSGRRVQEIVEAWQRSSDERREVVV